MAECWRSAPDVCGGAGGWAAPPRRPQPARLQTITGRRSLGNWTHCPLIAPQRQRPARKAVVKQAREQETADGDPSLFTAVLSSDPTRWRRGWTRRACRSWPRCRRARSGDRSLTGASGASVPHSAALETAPRPPPPTAAAAAAAGRACTAPGHPPCLPFGEQEPPDGGPRGPQRCR